MKGVRSSQPVIPVLNQIKHQFFPVSIVNEEQQQACGKVFSCFMTSLGWSWNVFGKWLVVCKSQTTHLTKLMKLKQTNSNRQHYKSDVMFVKKGISEVLTLDFVHVLLFNYTVLQIWKYARMLKKRYTNCSSLLHFSPKDFINWTQQQLKIQVLTWLCREKGRWWLWLTTSWRLIT